MRDTKFLSRWKQYYLCLNSQSQLSASVSPILQAAPADRPISAQVEVRRSSSTGMMGVRRKNVMKKVAS